MKFLKIFLTTVFNQLMENQRTEYIQADDYERSESRQSQRNGYYERDFTTRVGTLELKVPRTRDGEFAPTVFERYQRNENNVKQCQFESNSAGGRTADKVQELVKAKGGVTHITKKRTTANKLTKIIVNSDFVKKRFLFKDASKYSANSPYGRMMHMMCSFTVTGKNKNDDVPDGLAQLAEYVQSLEANRVEVFKRPF